MACAYGCARLFKFDDIVARSIGNVAHSGRRSTLLLLLLTLAIFCGAQWDNAGIISEIQMNDTSFPFINRASTLAGMTPYGYRGDAKRVHDALRRDLDQNGNLTIAVLGASVTIGFKLPNWYQDRYTTLLAGHLRRVFAVNVTVHNLAIRAASSDSQCDILFHKKINKIRRASLVLVDISVNDRPSHRQVKDRAKSESRSAGANMTAEEAQQQVARLEKVGAEGRKLMKLLQYYLPKTVGIVYFETFVSGGR